MSQNALFHPKKFVSIYLHSHVALGTHALRAKTTLAESPQIKSLARCPSAAPKISPDIGRATRSDFFGKKRKNTAKQPKKFHMNDGVRPPRLVGLRLTTSLVWRELAQEVLVTDP